MPATLAMFPKKLFYKINEVAEVVGVEAYVLRYWETKFPMLKPERYGNDERRYRSRDIELLLRIRRLLYDEKFTIAGAVERVRKDPKGQLDSEPAQASASVVELSPPAAEVEGEREPVMVRSLEAAEERLDQLELVEADAVERLAFVRRELAAIRAELAAMVSELAG